MAWLGTGRPPTPSPAPSIGAPAIARTVTEATEAPLPGYPPSRGIGWTSLGVTAAHAAMVMRLTVDDDSDPMAIARDIVEPLTAHYTEILLYVHAPDQDTDMPVSRVQWTPSGGYVKTNYTRR